MKKWFFLLLISISFKGYTQADSTTTFTFSSFLKIVRIHHPMALQSRLQTKIGAANLLKARGGFDPKIQGDIAQKYFENKEYYDLGEGKLKVPTWFGIEFEAGYERNQGQFLNPENNIPTAGLWFAGISVPLGEGLFIDERRAELRKAQIMIKQTDAERELIFNELLYSAGIAYWDWFMAYHNLQVYQNALVLAQQRFDAVKQGAFLGDTPSIDTLEASIQLQNRILNLEQALLDYKNSTAFLSIYLWQEGVIPMELKEDILPERREEIENRFFQQKSKAEMDSLLKNHPELRKSVAKIDQLEIEKRWLREQLKPKLNLKYNPITEVTENNVLAEYSINNYTWGLQLEFPIFLRKERGKLNLIKLKAGENQLSLQNKQEVLAYKIQSAVNELETTKNQITVYRKTTVDYKGLLNGEKRLFDGGESSLFMVNSRELGFINAQIKLVELLTKNQKAKLKLGYALGNLN